jgi:hypothetical protein
MGKFRKKPVVIEARLFDGHNADQLVNWINEHADERTSYVGADCLFIVTLEGEMRADFGDWIIQGAEGS